MQTYPEKRAVIQRTCFPYHDRSKALPVRGSCSEFGTRLYAAECPWLYRPPVCGLYQAPHIQLEKHADRRTETPLLFLTFWQCCPLSYTTSTDTHLSMEGKKTGIGASYPPPPETRQDGGPSPAVSRTSLGRPQECTRQTTHTHGRLTV